MKKIGTVEKIKFNLDEITRFKERQNLKIYPEIIQIILQRNKACFKLLHKNRCQWILEQDLRNVTGKLMKLLMFTQSRWYSVVSEKESSKNEKKKK